MDEMAALSAAFFFFRKKMATIGLRLIALYIGFFYDIEKEEWKEVRYALSSN
jgi:hypothetical protein